MSDTTIYSIGHSNRSAEEFLDLLRPHDISLLIDVRQYPGSKRHPQFKQGNLEGILRNSNIGYRHMKILGGRRGKPRADSPNGWWESPGFQAYADHLLTDEGQSALKDLLQFAEHKTVAIMCAEAVFWRCHRQVIADHLTARGHEVIHILGENQATLHELNPVAEVSEKKQVIYPRSGEQGELFEG